MRLGLGTAQLDLKYGVANVRGRMSRHDALALLEAAEAAGVVYIDTAPAYGSSEEIIGCAMPVGASFRIVTKSTTSPAPVRADAVVEGLKASLRRLRRNSVYGFLVHRAADLLGADGAGMRNALERIKREGLAEMVGVSLYTPQEVESILGGSPLDIVQVPVNVFDQRLVEGGHLAALRAAGIEIHVRSAFLQGALLSRPGALPSFLAGLDPRLEAFHALASQLGMTPAAAALGFLASVPEIDVVVCGVDGLDHFEQLCRSASQRLPSAAVAEFRRLACRDRTLIDPSLWPAT